MEDIVHRLGDEEIKLLKTLSQRRRERRAKAIRPACYLAGVFPIASLQWLDHGDLSLSKASSWLYGWR